LNEGEYVCEVLERNSDRQVLDGESGELVVTNLGRTASPVIRYRSGDIVVRQSAPCACGRTWARVVGGVLGRADDMVNIRGVNVYPGSIESVVRRFAEVAEFRSTVSLTGTMRALAVEVEAIPGAADGTDLAGRISRELRVALGLSVAVRVVEAGTLPRFEMKSRRFVLET
jgi:phenylacetate-CoA ligase